jgi:hypothetical protein
MNNNPASTAPQYHLEGSQRVRPETSGKAEK